MAKSIQELVELLRDKAQDKLKLYFEDDKYIKFILKELGYGSVRGVDDIKINNMKITDIIQNNINIINENYKGIKDFTLRGTSILNDSTGIIDNNFSIIKRGEYNIGSITISDAVLNIIDNNFSMVSRLADPPEASNNILTKENRKVIERNNNLIMEFLDRARSILFDSLGIIKRNDDNIKQLVHPPEGQNNILTNEYIKYIDILLKVNSSIDPPSASDNILTKQTLDIINNNYAIIQRGKDPFEASNNILVPETLDIINNNFEIIQRGKDPVEASNNILVPETLDIIDRNYKEIQRGKDPFEASNNILVDGLNKPGFGTINTISKINENFDELQEGKHPIEGENNIMVPETMDIINRNYSQIQEGKHPIEGENNILVDGLNKPGFGTINTISRINENYSQLQEGKHPIEGENNILVDGVNKDGFGTINTITRINENFKELQEGKHPIEGENNILVDGLNKPGFGTINTISRINENFDELQEGKHPIEGENNILVDGVEMDGFGTINTITKINENFDELQKGVHPVSGEDNILVDGLERPGFGTINTITKINENFQELQKGKHPTSGEDNILVDGLERKGFGTINTITKINENFDELQEGKHPVSGEDNILVDGIDKPGFGTINTITKISENFDELQEGAHPVSGEDNILVDGIDKSGFGTINTITRINENFDELQEGAHPVSGEDNILVPETLDIIDRNFKQLQEGKHPTSGEDNILVDGLERKGFGTINTISRIDENNAILKEGSEPDQGSNNILIDGVDKPGFGTINTISRINENFDTIQQGKHPISGEDNILVNGLERLGFGTINTLDLIESNNRIVKLGEHPPEAFNNIADSDSQNVRDYVNAIIDKVKLSNRWSDDDRYTDSMFTIDNPNFTLDESRYSPRSAWFTSGDTFIGNFNSISLTHTYSPRDHGMYDVGKFDASNKDNLRVNVWSNEDIGIGFNRPLSLTTLIDKEIQVINNMEDKGYIFQYDISLNRVGNLETLYVIGQNFQRGKDTGYNELSKYRNYFINGMYKKNTYANLRVRTEPTDINIVNGPVYNSAINSQSKLYPLKDQNGYYFLPLTGDEGPVYENTPIVHSDESDYAMDPLSTWDSENSMRNLLRIKNNIDRINQSVNKFGENQHELMEYSLNYQDVPSLTWESTDQEILDFRYYDITKPAAAFNPGGYSFGSSKISGNKYDGTMGHRRQIDYYRNNPEISYALDNMRKLFLANPRNAQIFDPIAIFWHPNDDLEFKSAAVDTRKDLRLLGGGPPDYLGYFRSYGAIEAIGNLMGGSVGNFVTSAAPFIEAGLDIISGGDQYTKRLYASEGIVFAELSNSGQFSLDSNNLFSRGLDIASQFINPGAFTLLNDLDKYQQGLGGTLFDDAKRVILSAKLGLALGQIAGPEFRVMRGRDSLTPAQELLSGDLNLNSALELSKQVFGNRVDDIDFIDGPSSYHEYMTDPRTWNIDQRLIWNNLGGKYENLPEVASSEAFVNFDPITMALNALKYAGINLDDPFGNDNIYDDFKEMVVGGDASFSKYFALQRKKRISVVTSKISPEGQLYKDEESKNVFHPVTSSGTRPDWFREVSINYELDEIKQAQLQILNDYSLETNMDPTKFERWYQGYNDGNVQYQYSQASGDKTTAGKIIPVDFYEYIGTVKVAQPDIEKINKARREGIQKQATDQQEASKITSFTVTADIKNDRDGFVGAEAAMVAALKPENIGDASIAVDQPIKAGTKITWKVSKSSGWEEDELNTIMQGVTDSMNGEATFSGSDFEKKGSSVSESQLDQVESDSDIAAKQGIKPVTFGQINTLLNEIEPQVFRFWIRPISRTHYEVTPEVYYLDDNNKVALARPRYTGHSLVMFDAVVKSYTDNFTPSWNSVNFFGRSENIYTWQSTSRAADIATVFTVTSPSQMPALRAKVQELIRMLYPQMQTIKYAGTISYRSGPIIELALGDQVRVYGAINSLSINWGINGEPTFELIRGGQFIKGCELNMNISVINKELPHAGTEFFAESFNPSVFYHPGVKSGKNVKTTSSYILLSEGLDKDSRQITTISAEGNGPGVVPAAGKEQNPSGGQP